MSAGSDTPTFGGAQPLGATMQAEYMGRTMKCYPVHESELEMLSTLNTDATIYASVGSAFLAFGVGIYTNTAFAEKLTPGGELATKLGAPVLIFLAIVCGILWLVKTRARSSAWERIKGEAVTLRASQVIEG